MSISYGFNMADNTREVRIEEQLKVKIGEAKNLNSRNAVNTSCSTQGTRDVYCTIALDQEEICRTPIIERTLSPFFGEEYQFKIPRRFRYLSIYVWDRDRHIKQDKPIGKVAIKREQLHLYNHKDHWFSLQPVDSNSEVQGIVLVEVQFEEASLQINDQRINLIRPSTYERNNGEIIEELENQTQCCQALQNDYKENNTLGNQQRNSIQKVHITNLIGDGGGGIGCVGDDNLFYNIQQHNNIETFDSNWKCPLTSMRHHSKVLVKVPECHNLPKKNGSCDPYVVCTGIYSNKRQISKRTKLRRKTVNPTFDEVMAFDLRIDADNTTTSTKSSMQIQMQARTMQSQSLQCDKTNLDGGGIHSNKTYTIYPMGGADLCEIQITLWHDASGMSDKVFLGEVKIPLKDKQQLTAVLPSAWYYLQPRTINANIWSMNTVARSCATPPGTRLSGDSTIGSLRLKLLYTADHVFPLATYDDLMNLLLESVNQRPITLSAVYIMGELVSCKTDIAQPLVRLFTHSGRIASIIKALADHEISNLTDPTTIFRGNTLVSKMMDEAMRLLGLHYLHQTLRPVLAQILIEKKPCEIDPSKVKDRSVVESNLHHLEDYVEKVFDAITKSAVRCPKVLCEIFYDLRECAARHFPRNREVRYSVVSGFIFLRFFAPAILGPKLFDLTTEPLECQTNRTLTLISKTIQSLGNLVSSRSSQQPCKEEYTGQLYKKFCTEKHIEAVKIFLENISTSPFNETRNSQSQSQPETQQQQPQQQQDHIYLYAAYENISEPILLKEGMMIKYLQSRKRFGRRPFKQRYFRLTTKSFSYAKSKGKQPICDIPLEEIDRVEQLNDKSFKMQNCFKVVRKDRSLIVQTNNCVEEQEWIDLLHKICYTNSMRSQYFHPSAFVNGYYSCCKRSDENAPGCKNISQEAINYFQMDLIAALDPALDLQRIHTLLMSNMVQIEAYLSYHDDYSHTLATQHNALITAAIILQQQSPRARSKFKSTILHLLEIAYTIHKDHLNYKQGIARELKYGSREAPIGDDNYLQMMRVIEPHDPQHDGSAGNDGQQQQQQKMFPKMQLVMAYPFNQQLQQQQKFQQQQQLQMQQFQQQQQLNQLHSHQHQHSSTNAYLLHNIQHHPQHTKHQQHHHQHQQQQQQQQPQPQQNNLKNLMYMPFLRSSTISQHLQQQKQQEHQQQQQGQHCITNASSSNSSTTSNIKAHQQPLQMPTQSQLHKLQQQQQQLPPPTPMQIPFKMYSGHYTNKC